jgi:hypothetical protein
MNFHGSGKGFRAARSGSSRMGAKTGHKAWWELWNIVIAQLDGRSSRARTKRGPFRSVIPTIIEARTMTRLDRVIALPIVLMPMTRPDRIRANIGKKTWWELWNIVMA